MNQLSGLFDWVTSPVETAKATWRGILANWTAVESKLASDLNVLTDLRVQVPPELFADIQADWQSTANALSAMEVLDDDAAAVRDWFNANENGAMGAAFPVVGIAYAAAAAAALGAGVAVINKAFPDRWSQVAAQYNQLKAQGATDAEALAAVREMGALAPDTSSMIMALGLVAAVFFLPQVMKGRK